MIKINKVNLIKSLNYRIPWKSSALIALTGLILFIATSIALFSDWSDAKIRHVWPPNTQRFRHLNFLFNNLFKYLNVSHTIINI